MVTNSGNVTVKDIELSDTLVTLSQPKFNLKPGDTKTITYTYTVTQADVDAGKIDNTVTASGKDPKDNPIADSKTVEVTTVAPSASIEVTKTGFRKFRDTINGVEVGDTIEYLVTVTNTGNVTVNEGSLRDTKVDLSGETFTLAPRDTAEFTYEYTVTQADVDAGIVANTITAKAKDPKGNTVEGTRSNSVPTVEAKPALTVEKTADPASDVKVGDEVTYTVVVTNSGNVTVKDIAMSDSLVTLSEEAFTLAPQRPVKTRRTKTSQPVTTQKSRQWKQHLS